MAPKEIRTPADRTNLLKGEKATSLLIYPENLGNIKKVKDSTDDEKRFFFIMFAPYKIQDSKYNYSKVTDSQGRRDFSKFMQYVPNGDRARLEEFLKVNPPDQSDRFNSRNSAAVFGNANQYVDTEQRVIMYMPDSVKVQYSADLAQMDFGDLGNIISEGTNAANDWKELAKRKLLELGVGMGSSIFKLDASKNISLAERLTGKAFNPVSDLVFKNMKLREFSYEFRFSPRTENETYVAKSIIQLFKFHMHPEVDQNLGKFYYQYPSQFLIYYMSSDGSENIFTHKIGSCYLESCDVDLTPNNMWSSHIDGSPAEIRLGLRFKETMVLTKENLIDSVDSRITF